jgi:hypothetical protein
MKILLPSTALERAAMVVPPRRDSAFAACILFRRRSAWDREARIK